MNYAPGAGEGGSEGDDDDDAFDDEDGEEPKSSSDQLKIGNLAKLACSMRGTLNQNVMPYLEDDWRDDVRINTKGMVLAMLASYNEWYPLVEHHWQK